MAPSTTPSLDGVTALAHDDAVVVPEGREVEDLYLNPPSWYAQHQPHRFSYHLQEAVTSISPENNFVHTSKNRSFSYSKCVIATGSSADLPPYVPPEAASKTRGVFVYRNIADLDGIIAYAEKPEVQHAVVVGGGLLGLEAAKAAYDLPSISRVSIVNRQAYPLSRQLDADAGEMVLHQIEAMGVQVLTRCSPTRQITRNAEDGSGSEIFAGFELQDGSIHEADLVIYAIGIRPRDDVARSSGIQCHPRGGIIVGDDLKTSADNVYAIGECASWRENSYGLIGPGGVLMGVDVASFGDFFVDKRLPLGRTHDLSKRIVNGAGNQDRPAIEISIDDSDDVKALVRSTAKAPSDRKGRGKDQSVNCLIYKDPFGATYKKYIFTEDGKYLLGGMMVGDVSDFVKLVAIKALEVPPSQFIIGAKKGDDGGDDLDDDAQICSCHNVSKGDVVKCVKEGTCLTIPDLKVKTKVGTGSPPSFNAEMKKAGRALNTNLCPHFAMSRTDLFSVIKVKGLRSFQMVMENVGTNKTSIGCEFCKPAIGSILSSLCVPADLTSN
ncbi:hypothetical protein H0H87_007887 [Tephrocybe sp. NHM501043]|nr:hypothetical protein H0H87_007887 [Tephrocybe sp. NHM501043]